MLCTICSERFTRADQLKEHIKIHTGECQYSCAKCSRRFTQASNLEQHTFVPFDQRFIEVDHLKGHLIIHTEKLWVCTSCPERFTRTCSQKIHTAIHMRDAQFKQGTVFVNYLFKEIHQRANLNTVRIITKNSLSLYHRRVPRYF